MGMRRAMDPDHVEGMSEAWALSEEGGTDPLAHMDIFANYIVGKANGKDAAGNATWRIKWLESFLCRASESEIDLEAQTEKLVMVRGALKAQYKKAFSIDSLRTFDDILQKNLEEFSGPPCVRLSPIEGAPMYLGKGRYQGLFA